MKSIRLRSLVVWVALLVSVSTVCAQAPLFGPAASRVRAAAEAASYFARTALPCPAWRAVGRGVPGMTARALNRLSRRGRRSARLAPASPVIAPPAATPAYQRTFRVLSGRRDITDRYDGLIIEHARRRGLDPRLVKAIIAAESEFSAGAVSPRGARGLMQVMPATAEEMGVPRGGLSDPEDGIKAGTAYLDKLYRAAARAYKLKGVPYASAPPWLLQRVIAAYNAGPRSLTHARWRPVTRDYVRKVLLFHQSTVADLRPAPRRGILAFLFGG